MKITSHRLVVGVGLFGLLGQGGWAWAPNRACQNPLLPPAVEREIPLAALPAQTILVPRSFPGRIFRIPVTVTAYSSTPDQTDDTPEITAMNTPVRPGIIALSRDLLREFTRGAPFRFGDVVELEGVGLFSVEDTMNPRYTKRVDIWFQSRNAAQDWGKRSLCLAKLTPIAQASQYLVEASGSLFEPALAD